jgi:tetratricopeptide (TPR) repeat protein
LAVVLYGQGDYDGARQYLERALAINEKVLGEEHPRTKLTRENLGYFDTQRES